MTQFLLNYQTLFDFFLLSIGFAFSQQVVLRAGVFSVATAGFAAIGAYATAIAIQRQHIPPLVALGIALFLGGLVGFALSIPLARLRGVFQAIATLAFVEVIVSLAFYMESWTGGALGLYNIPKVVGTGHLVFAVAILAYVMWALGRSGIGRAFDGIRQDETVGATLGVSITRSHALAFVISGAIGGFFGGLQSLYVYSIEPQMFGFGFLVSVLTFIILGGRRTVLGPIVGAAIMTALPELGRPLAENRQLLQGLIMMGMIALVPHGVVDSIVFRVRQRKAVESDRRYQTAKLTDAAA